MDRSVHFSNTSHNVGQSFSQRIPPQKVIKITQKHTYEKVYMLEHLRYYLESN